LIKAGRVGIAVLLAAATLFSVSGCVPLSGGDVCNLGTPIPPKTNDPIKSSITVIFQATNDFPDALSAITQDSRLSLALPKRTEEAPLAYTVVAADGRPNVIFKGWIKKNIGDGDFGIQEKSKRALGGIGDIYSCAFSSKTFNSSFDKNLDLIYALSVGAEALDSPYGTKKMFIYSNGFQTAGQPNFSEIFLKDESDALEILGKLEEARALPNLEGVEVYWTGLGEATADRDPLLLEGKNLLQFFWTELIVRSGGSIPEGFSTGTFKEASPEGAANSADMADFEGLCFSATLGERQGFEFQPNSADFIDRSVANAEAALIAESIQKSTCGTSTIRVTGFTASGTSRDAFEPDSLFDQKLSKARAQAFADLLINQGVIVTDVVGGGKGALTDWNKDGSFNIELGKLNRIVKIEEVR
jgi:outer membrane protein OmpA-like peptidoglycan-associated protein